MKANSQKRDPQKPHASTARARSLEGHIEKIEQQIGSGSIGASEGLPLLDLLKSELEDETKNPKPLVQPLQKKSFGDETGGITKVLLSLYLLSLVAGIAWLAFKGTSWIISELYLWLLAWSKKEPPHFNFWWAIGWGLGMYCGGAWCSAHSSSRRGFLSSDTCYPHPCHFFVALYIALPAFLFAFVTTVRLCGVLIPNPLLLATSGWHLVRAFKLFRAWRRNESLDE